MSSFSGESMSSNLAQVLGFEKQPGVTALESLRLSGAAHLQLVQQRHQRVRLLLAEFEHRLTGDVLQVHAPHLRPLKADDSGKILRAQVRYQYAGADEQQFECR